MCKETLPGWFQPLTRNSLVERHHSNTQIPVSQQIVMYTVQPQQWKHQIEWNMELLDC